ncbi:MAG TPA: hypothetical protein VGH74_16900 [Planctomycetaceae bacterium]
MGDANRDPPTVYYRMVITGHGGAETVRARNVSIKTAEAIRAAVLHMGQVRIERQRDIDRAD